MYLMSVSGDPAFLKSLSDATWKAVRDAEINLPPDVKTRLEHAHRNESVLVARKELENILENIRLAEERSAPLCQDTGIPVMYVTIPPGFSWSPEMEQAVHEGIKKATNDVPLRPNLVHPLTREIPGQTPALRCHQFMYVLVTGLPSRHYQRSWFRECVPHPHDESVRKGSIPRFIVETMLKAGGRPCPPVFWELVSEEHLIKLLPLQKKHY
jgi:hydro-lyases, Fe-S type, tartrate/fumarate subfamily, alpha region